MSAARSTKGRREPHSWADRIDWATVARGASRGFTVLVLTDMLFLIVERLNPVAGVVWLVAGAVAGSTLAAWKSGSAISAEMTGAIAAGFSFTLTLPLMYMASSTAKMGLNWYYVAGLGVLGLLVGAAVGRRQGNQLPPAADRRR